MRVLLVLRRMRPVRHLAPWHRATLVDGSGLPRTGRTVSRMAEKI